MRYNIVKHSLQPEVQEKQTHLDVAFTYSQKSAEGKHTQLSWRFEEFPSLPAVNGVPRVSVEVCGAERQL